MMNPKLWCIGLVGMGLLVGCQPQDRPAETTAPEEPITARQQQQADPAQRFERLRVEADELASWTDALPGRNEQQHREVMSDGLLRLANLLETLRGSRATGDFRIQVRSIRSAADRIAAAPPSLPMETTIAGALRSAYNALDQVRQDQFGRDPNIQEELSALQSDLSDLEPLRGPLHRQAAAGAYRQAVRVVQTMAEQYSSLVASAGATTQPAQ